MWFAGKAASSRGLFRQTRTCLAGWGDPPGYGQEREETFPRMPRKWEGQEWSKDGLWGGLSMRQTAFFINDPRHRSPGTRLRTRTGQWIWAGKRSAEAARRRGWKTCINRGPVFPAIPAAYSLTSPSVARRGWIEDADCPKETRRSVGGETLRHHHQHGSKPNHTKPRCGGISPLTATALAYGKKRSSRNDSTGDN
ncbi:hypothetical protein BGZ61DRAFT_197705 [Ilyonectria robusta]|uniref:uncharacterized protein n=1 Tax=Ilyonectria robusta TaxID=1079257 RepID=UPI001E8D7D88|nr:uncharacterized protein BGZ61DRAFT_197705 [Ilyonectria robusta]KAH8721975.1 hypothetical protein BGZ61DRAFT_197705 [Ilyonectria robusta]